MKLLRLDLSAFGSLKGVQLDFASQEPCLHVVYGPNEAGKSTALRAISGLFYGIPESTPDVHSIKGPELRIGARVCDARGRELQVMRRKGRKDTLRAETGEPLAGADASWLTAGVSEAAFHALFGLNFASLHEGADELLGSAGDLGQSLYSAAVGGSRVRALMEALRHEAELLFKPRGQTQKLNVALKQFDEAKKRSREQGMQASAFTEQQEAIDAAQLEDERSRAENIALRTERGRLERARRVIPLLAKRSEVLRELSTLGAVPRLAADAADLRRAAESAKREASVSVEHVQTDIAAIEQELSALEVDEALAVLESSLVDDLQGRLGVYRRGKGELPRRTEACARAHDEIRRAAIAAGATDVTPDLERLRVPKSLAARVREQARLGDKLASDNAERARVRSGKQSELDRQRAQISQLWAAADSGAGDLFARVSLPSDETAEEYERAFQSIEQAERALAARQAEALTRLEQNRRDLETLELTGAPPTEAELLRLRTERTAAIASLRASLEAGAKTEPPVTLLDRASQLIEQADTLSDRLRREATRVAENARLSADQQSIQRGVQALDDERRELIAKRGEVNATWQALLQRAGVSVRSPREVRRLLIEQRAGEKHCSELERELSALERERGSHAQVEQRWRSDWQQLAAQLGFAETASVLEIDALLGDRADLFARVDAAQVLARSLAELEHELRAFEVDALALCERHRPDSSSQSQSVELAAEQLIRLHQAARAGLVRRQQLTAALSTRQRDLSAAQAAVARAERELTQLMQTAKVEDGAALEAAEIAAARVRELEQTRALLHDELLAASDGISPEAVLQDAPASLDEVRARLVAVDETLEELDRDRQRVAQTLASLRAGLDRLRESHGASDAALDAATQLETVRALAEQFVRTRLAASVLKREVDRYRERNKGTILRAASELFENLTLSGFSGLDVDYTQGDEPLLSCVRKDGSHLGVEGLSTGTRDQLYLALRLASIEHLATRQELMPLVLDDILVHFDDDRARAALAALGKFTQTTQVLFFTHHKRLCELAGEALPPSKLKVHRLGDGPSQVVTLYT